MTVGQMMFDQKARHPQFQINRPSTEEKKHETISLDGLKL
jgi:hypothetical protein